MDINSLLSPQDSPAPETPSPFIAAPIGTPKKRPSALEKRASSSLSQQVVPSHGIAGHLLLPQGIVSQAQQETPSPTIASLSAQSERLLQSATTTPTIESRGAGYVQDTRMSMSTRQPSTPQMDTLADLASMQQQQQVARQNANGLRSNDVNEGQRASVQYNAQRPPMSARSSRDLLMADAPAEPTLPRAYVASSLSKADLETVTNLASYVAENTHAYDSHVQLVNLLHRGFVHHVNPPEAADNTGDPRYYGLLQDLRQAREAMNTRFLVGEELWIDWLQDEMLLAKSAEDCISVMELFQKAVTDEPGSVKLWRMYGDYLWQLHDAANSQNTQIGKEWLEDDKLMAVEIFKWDLMFQVWQQGVDTTQWHLNDSHLVWDRYIEALTQELSLSPSTDGVQQIKSLYLERLRQPHAQWDSTFQQFSSFITRYDQTNYEQEMVSANQQASDAKKTYALRGELEFRLDRASQSGDKDAEWTVFQEYLQYELHPPKGAAFDMNLAAALFDRAVTRFPTDANLWEEYVVLLMDQESSSYSALPLLERATRHCPWSGDLWSKRLLVCEVAGRPFEEMEEIKHKATKTALQDIGSMDEIVKVYTQWCGYLRRRAFAFETGATEDNIDEAEMGIRSTLEDVAKIGEKKYGKDFKGDPKYRIERIYCKFLTQAGHIQQAREQWRSLIPQHGNSFDFWYSFHRWEMLVWGRSSFMKGAVKGTGELRDPTEVTKVLREAIRRPNLDWPEKIIDLFINHCEQNESAQELELASVEAHKAIKRTQARRAKEAEAAAAEQQIGLQQDVPDENEDATKSNGKRKREVDAEEKPGAKRSKGEDPSHSEELGFGDPSSGATAQAKRDRENATITVKNLPSTASELKVRQFFRDCGTINSINLLPDDTGPTQTATIEFESRDDVVTAKTQDGKLFDGQEVRIQSGSGSTLWVTNFPPSADEAVIRQLFKPYGDVVEVRFPSLHHNTHRRFCYVQFLTAEQAHAATALDGNDFQGYNIVAKISDPNQKKDRVGATHEGREIFVGNLHFNATEKDLRELFAPYGAVESVRIPLDLRGRSKGTGFVVFESKEQATAALAENLKPFRGRILKVAPGVPNAKGIKRTATTIGRAANSASPAPDQASASAMSVDAEHPDTASNAGEAGTPGGADSAGANAGAPKRARTLALLNIPDTVNDTRVRALVAPHGAVRKLTLRPDHGGALVEFETPAEAGRASLALEGVEVEKGRRIRVGGAEELWRSEGVHVGDRVEVGKGKGKDKKGEGKSNGSTPLFGQQPISRPGQRGGRRGGLGLKRGGVLGGKNGGDEGVKGGEQKGKTQDDFRAMLGKKEDQN
ncbi:MAG: Splicing factor [Bathelium mastoideum]|nr:MAG: Splicing factor [Bathelium mastoideum]